MKTRFIIGLLAVLGAIYFFTSKTETEEVISVKQNPIHIILGLDPSGSTKEWPWPNRAFFEQQIQLLENAGGGTLEIYNFSNCIPRPVRVTLQPLKTVPDVYSGEIEVKQVEAYNASVSSQNTKVKNLFWKDLEQKILNYEPIKGKDYTYVNLHCNSIRQSLMLPQYNGYSQYALLYSDLVDDTPRSKSQDLHDELLVEIAGLSQLGICSHNPSKDYSEIGAISLPDYNDFNGIIEQSNNFLTSNY